MRVLCAYRDPESGGAAPQAIRGLVRDDDEVVAIHIIEPADLPWAATEAEFFSAAERDVAAREARIVEAAAASGLRATVVVDVPTTGEAAAARIAREARERSADLLVVASKRASGVRGLLLGSVAQALLQLAHARCWLSGPPARRHSE